MKFSAETAFIKKETPKTQIGEAFTMQTPLEEYEQSLVSTKKVSLGKRGTLTELYKKEFPGNNEYKIESLGTEKIDEMFFKLINKTKQETTSELRFRTQVNKNGESFLNMHHRLVRSQDIGVNGSIFLKKAEEYLSFLKNKISNFPKEICIGSAQPNVTDWLLKNGYSFADDKSQLIHEYILENKAEYRLIKMDNLDGISNKDQAFIQKDAFSDPEFLKYLDTSGGDEVVRISFNELRKFQKYIPSIFMRKEL